MSNKTTFSIAIVGQASQFNGQSVPICEISSPVKISNAGHDYDAYSSDSLIVKTKNGQYVASFVFWEASRIHADIGELSILMVNFGDKVVIVTHSKTKKFSVKTSQGIEDKACNKSGIWHCFAVISDGEAINIEEEQ